MLTTATRGPRRISVSAIDNDAATVGGYWVGIAGFVVGLIGIGLTLYTMFTTAPDALIIAGSGWLAAVLVTGTSWRITEKLLKHAKSCERETKEALIATKDALIAKQSLQAAHDRLATISEFLATKTMRPATPRTTSISRGKADQTEDGKDAD
jgi:hypothetical protein